MLKPLPLHVLLPLPRCIRTRRNERGRRAESSFIIC